MFCEYIESNLIDTIQKLTGTGQFDTIQDDDEMWHVRNDSYYIKLDHNDYSFDIRILDKDIYQKNSVDNLDEELYLKKSYELIDSIGARRDEMKEKITYLMAFNRDNMDDVEYESFPVEKAFLFERLLGGIQVVGNFITISFGMDGRLLAMVGRWVPVNYSGSQLYSNITEEQMVEKALQRLMYENVDPNEEHVITVGSYYNSVKKDSKWVLDLEGIVRAEKGNGTERPTGGAKGGEFDI